MFSSKQIPPQLARVVSIFRKIYLEKPRYTKNPQYNRSLDPCTAISWIDELKLIRGPPNLATLSGSWGGGVVRGNPDPPSSSLEFRARAGEPVWKRGKTKHFSHGLGQNGYCSFWVVKAYCQSFPKQLPCHEVFHSPRTQDQRIQPVVKTMLGQVWLSRQSCGSAKKGSFSCEVACVICKAWKGLAHQEAISKSSFETVGRCFLMSLLKTKTGPGRMKLGCWSATSFFASMATFPTQSARTGCYHLGEGPGFLEAQREVVLVEVI